MARPERISSVVLVIFGVFVAYYARHYLKLGMMISPGAGFIPFYVGIALVALGVIWFGMTLRVSRVRHAATGETDTDGGPDGGEPVAKNILLRFLPGVLLVILYAWLFEKAGYLLSTVLFMVGWQKVVERGGWLKTAVVSALCGAAMYVLFAYLLKIALPTGTWFA